MGNYLTSPNSTKDCENGSFEKIRYGTCAMQGWRISMEDAHLIHHFNHIESLGNSVALFGVYDGHGGPQVSQFVCRHMVDELLKLSDFRKGRFDTAFRAAYLSLDQLMSQSQYQHELEWLLQMDPTTPMTTDLNSVPNSVIHTSTTGSGITIHEGKDISKVVPQSTNQQVVVASEPQKSGGFRSSVKLRGRRLYRRVGHGSDKKGNKKKLDLFISDSVPFTGTKQRVNNVDKLSSFESIDVSDEYGLRHSTASTRTPHKRNSDSSSQSGSLPFSCPSSAKHYSGDRTNRNTSDNHIKISPDSPTSEGVVVSSLSSDCIPIVINDALSPNHLITSTTIEPLVIPDLNNHSKALVPFRDVDTPASTTPNSGSSFFSLQGIKSLLSGMMRIGSIMGRHGNSAQGGLAMLAGCTAISVLVTETHIVVANAGDSRCVLCRGDVALELSKDHKPSLPEERSRIYSAGGWLEMGRVNGNLNLSRALGDLVYKGNTTLPAERQIVSAVPDVVVIDIVDEDKFLVIGCDGIWESSPSQEIVSFINERIDGADKLSDVLESLFDELLSPNPTLFEFGCDNMTAILVDLQRHRRNPTISSSDPLEAAENGLNESTVTNNEKAETQSNSCRGSLAVPVVFTASQNVNGSERKVVTAQKAQLLSTTSKKVNASSLADTESFWEKNAGFQGSKNVYTSTQIHRNIDGNPSSEGYETWEQMIVASTKSKPKPLTHLDSQQKLVSTPKKEPKEFAHTQSKQLSFNTTNESIPVNQSSQGEQVIKKTSLVLSENRPKLQEPILPFLQRGNKTSQTVTQASPSFKVSKDPAGESEPVSHNAMAPELVNRQQKKNGAMTQRPSVSVAPKFGRK